MQLSFENFLSAIFISQTIIEIQNDQVESE